MPVPIQLGYAAKRLRERVGYSQRRLAELLGYTTEHICRIERDKAKPSPELIEEYDRLFGFDLHVVAWILRGDVTRLPQSLIAPTRKLTAEWRWYFDGDPPGGANDNP